MKTILQKAMVISMLLIGSTEMPNFAQSSTKQSGDQPQNNDHPGIILRGSDVLNAKIFSQNGEELGHIRDVLLDPKTGNISYAVLGMGGWQGIRETFAIVPWQMIKQDEQKAENYIIQVDREKVRTAPTFENAQWATVIQPDYLSKIQSYYAAPPALPKSQAQSQTAKASSTPAPAAPAATPSPAVAGTQKAPPESTPTRQAESRPRKDPQQNQQKSRTSSGNHGRVGTEP